MFAGVATEPSLNCEGNCSMGKTKQTKEAVWQEAY